MCHGFWDERLQTKTKRFTRPTYTGRVRGCTLGVRHLQSENTTVRVSVFRNCKDSSEKNISVPLSAVFEPDNVGCYQHTEAQHGLGGAYNMTVCAPGSDSIFSQHIHMLTPGLPVFFSAASTCFP